jgi:uncharacterized membrane protein
MPEPLDYASPPRIRRHSRLGVASFALGVLAILALFLSLRRAAPGDPPVWLLALLTLGTPGCGMFVGVLGLLNSENKRAFSVTGIILNGIVLLLFLLGVVALVLQS